MQDPIISYLYTKKREIEKLRNVPTSAFIDKFYLSVQTVREMMDTYPKALVFVTKKLKSLPKFSDIQVKNIQQFDNLTIYRYTIEDLTKIIDTLNDSCKKDP
jgi:hypothetical protein